MRHHLGISRNIYDSLAQFPNLAAMFRNRIGKLSLDLFEFNRDQRELLADVVMRKN